MNVAWISKLAGLASIGEALSTVALVRKLLGEIAAIVALTIVGAMLTGAFAVAGIYECYAVMVRHGVGDDWAALITAAIGIAAIGGVVAAAMAKIKSLRSLPFQLPTVNNMVAGPVKSLVKGFYHGVTSKRP